MSQITDNVAAVRARVDAAAIRSGRRPEDVLLVAATKMNDAERVREAVAAGVDACGENRVQELLEKHPAGAYEGKPVHFIGHLQSNKVRQIVGLVDLIQSVDSEALLQKIDAQCEKRGLTQDVLLEVNIGGEEAKSGVSPDELEGLLPLLPRLKAVDLRRSAFDAAQTDAFAAGHPALQTLFTVPLWGREIPGDTTELRLEAGSSGDPGELAAALARLTALKKLDLRDCDLTPSQLARVLSVCEGVETDYVIRLFGRTFTADCEEMDLSGIRVDELGEIEAAAALMPKLKKVVMCDCGVPDAEMDALDQRHEDIRFVWTVYFSIYALRTDATFFCAADVPQLNYDAPVLNDAQLYPVRYCRDMIALDLGHMWITDLSFLYNMPKLQYLILVGGRFRDITPIGSLQELKYLEIFQTQPADISPLLNCKKLEQLNMCYCFGFDLSPLKQMTQLKRLWFTGLGPYYGEQLAAALPDTLVYYPYNDPDGSTGGGWREDEAYYEMRDVFAMYYQPGGTGVHN